MRLINESYNGNKCKFPLKMFKKIVNTKIVNF